MRQGRLRQEATVRSPTLEQTMLKSGFTMSDINGINTFLSVNKQVLWIDWFCLLLRTELQYGYEAQDGQQAGRPAVPVRRGRTSIDAAPMDPGAAGEVARKGGRAVSEMHPGGRQTRDDRKAKSPDVSQDQKKRGKSPFKY